MALLSIENLHLSMASFEGEANILNGVDLAIERGEIWGLVGETGCGKSLTGLSVSRLVSSPAAHYHKGHIQFDGQDVLGLSEADMRRLRGRRIGMIFQDPTTNLNPLFTIGEQMEDVALHAMGKGQWDQGARDRAREQSIEMLERVGIVSPQARLNDYPHQFSGGMRQRVLIAMALIGKPDLLIADEPTTALDVSVQAQILKLLFDIVQQDQIAVMLITHNLGVVARLCTHVAVMYAGRIVERGSMHDVFKAPAHPYTQALLKSVPTLKTAKGSLKGLDGQVPDLFMPQPGCRFAPRCGVVMETCHHSVPPEGFNSCGQSQMHNHLAACFRIGEPA
jgi:peptide/nickel transport system ATP-binding protein